MKRFLSLLLSLLFCLSTFSVLGITVSAASGQQISEGRKWDLRWSAEDEFAGFIFDVDSSGIYNINISDRVQNGYLYISIYDGTGEAASYWETIESEDITASFTSQDILLLKGHQYTLLIIYYTYIGEEYILLDADMSLSFSESNVTPTEMPTSYEASINFKYDFSPEHNAYFKYRSGEAGNYVLHFNYLHGFISVYNASTGEIASPGVIDTEYWNYFTSDWLLRDYVRFDLEANTDYYIMIEPYVAATSNLYMMKNKASVQNISVNEPLKTFTSLSYIDESCFDYKITYSDGTTRTIWDSDALQAAGYTVPDISLNCDYIHINNGYYLPDGDLAISSVYNGIETVVYVHVYPIVSAVGHLSPLKDDSQGQITYETDEEKCYWWHVKVDSDGYYGIVTSGPDKFSTNFEYYSMVIVDEYNNVVPFDKYENAWYLSAKKVYALGIRYKYDENHTYNTINFKFNFKPELKTGWAKENGKWYYYYKGSKVYNSWQKDSVGWCYLGSDGATVKNLWVKDGSKWCYVGSDGYRVYNKWVKDSVGWCYIGSDGYTVYNKWVKDSSGWFYIGSDGHTVRNQWAKDSTGWFYIGSDGHTVRNQWVKDSTDWCYIGSDGHPVKNAWVKDSGGWLYMGSNGYPLRNGWAKDSTGWCYLNASGRVARNQWIKDEGGWRYVSGSYRLTNAWAKDSAGWLYLGKDGYPVRNTWQKDSAGWCYLKSDARVAKNQWILDEGGWRYCNASGYRVTNAWQKDSAGWLYLGKDGYPVRNTWQKDSAVLCFLMENARVAKDMWVVDPETSNLCYVSGAYRVYDKLITDEYGTRYISPDGFAVYDTWVQFEEGKSFFGQDGIRIEECWIELEEGKYYAGADGYIVIGEVEIDGEKYTFDENGLLVIEVE